MNLWDGGEDDEGLYVCGSLMVGCYDVRLGELKDGGWSWGSSLKWIERLKYMKRLAEQV